MKWIATMTLAGFGTTAWACDRVSETHEVGAAIDEAYELYRELEIDKFREQVDVARKHIECLDTFLSRHHGAEFHRVEGVRLFVDRNSPEAQKHFAAARALEPNYSFPTDLVPEGNPLLDDYQALEPIAGSFETVARPRAGSIKLDGSSTLNRGLERPVTFQLADASGKVVLSKVLAAADAPPAYDAEESASTGGSEKAPKTPKEPREKGAKKGPSVPLLVVAGAAAVAAGGLYGGAFVSRGQWQGVAPNSGQVDKVNAARGLTNGLVVGSWIAGGVAVGMGTTAFVVNGRF